MTFLLRWGDLKPGEYGSLTAPPALSAAPSRSPTSTPVVLDSPTSAPAAALVGNRATGFAPGLAGSVGVRSSAGDGSCARFLLRGCSSRALCDFSGGFMRFAESLDADIKRLASGKEGNLRALLSTLQYILGPESGWQPISLTEIITTAAVKKAYRKATLCVHPDKLQQRGASVQQKYVCEKVFDLLKAAWNRFNSDER